MSIGGWIITLFLIYMGYRFVKGLWLEGNVHLSHSEMEQYPSYIRLHATCYLDGWSIKRRYLHDFYEDD